MLWPLSTMVNERQLGHAGIEFGAKPANILVNP
jgi:hypothetical protein